MDAPMPKMRKDRKARSKGSYEKESRFRPFPSSVVHENQAPLKGAECAWHCLYQETVPKV